MSTNQAQREEALSLLAESVPHLRAFRDVVESAASRKEDANDDWIFDPYETLSEVDNLVEEIERLLGSSDSTSTESLKIDWEQIDWERVWIIRNIVYDILEFIWQMFGG